MPWKKAFNFALVVTLAGMALDIFLHLKLGTAVHFNYAIEKTLIVGLTLFLFSWWIGADWKHGIALALIATTIFFIYYQIAIPTLDRNVFTLDEQVKWIFIHWMLVYIPYLMALRFMDKALLAAPDWTASKKKFAVFAVTGFGLFALMDLPGVSFIVNNNLVIGRTYNDHIAIGICFLILGVAAVYKLATLSRKNNPAR